MTGISPSSGPVGGGTGVTITGSLFVTDGATGATIGGNTATAFVVVSETTITATTPAGSAGAADVTVTFTAGGPITLAGGFTYVPAPVVSGLSATSGPAAGGTPVTITGSNFTGATTVDFGATSASFTITDDTHIATTSPGGSGTVHVTVTTPSGTSTTSGADQFTYTAPGPAVSGLSATSGPAAGGTPVTISGSNFTGATTVDFGATSATFTITDDTHIATTSPGGSGTVHVTVTTPSGTSATSGADQFTYVVAGPTVSGVNPNTGPAAGGTPVTITGSNFTGASAVNFGGITAAFTVTDATHIAATSPASTGVVDVTVTTAGGTSLTSSADQFTYAGTPTVTSINPSIGPPTGGTLVTIVGSNFSPTSTVAFGGTPSTGGVTYVSSSAVKATSPAGTTGAAVDVTVTTIGGTSGTSSADLFTYAALPGAPTGVTAAAGNASAVVSWTAAASNGSTISSYTITSSPSVAIAPVSGTTLSATVTGLANGTPYTFTVFATNGFGNGPASTPPTPAVIPNLPTVTSITPKIDGIAGGALITVTGTNLGTATAVNFGANPAPPASVTATQLTVRDPAVPGAGTVFVTVTVSGGTSLATSAAVFTYTTACLTAALTTNPVQSQFLRGTAIGVTASSTGCPSPRYEFFLVYPNKTVILWLPWTAPGSATATLTLSTSSASELGIYTVRLGANQSGDSLATFEAKFSLSFTLVPGCVDGTISAGSTTSPQPAGTSVTFTASFVPPGPLCSAPEYEFWWQYAGGSWNLGQRFGSLSTWAWKAYLPGSYKIVVWANQTGTPLATYQSYAEMTMVLTGCFPVNISSSPAPPQHAGTPIQITGQASGCSQPLYEFWMLAPGSSTWLKVQAYPLTYPGSSTFNWNVNQLVGTYSLMVWARDANSLGAGGSSAGRWDSYRMSQYTLTSSNTCTAVTFTTSPSGTALAGTPVTITATASGCLNPLYQFWILAPGSSTWANVQHYSSVRTYNWSAVVRPAGTYTFAVWVRDSTSVGTYSGGLGRWDALFPGTYTLTSKPCTSVNISSLPASTATVGTPVTISGVSPIGCPSPLYQFWILKPGSTWQLLRAYTGSASYSWTTIGLAKGSYGFAVWVRDSSSIGTLSGGLGRWDALNSLTFQLT